MNMRPCWVEVDARALEDNLRHLSALAAPGVELLAMIKADAYGHGIAVAGPAAVAAGASWLGVTSVEEAVAARTACPRAEILVVSGAFPGQGPDVVRHRLTPSVWEGWQLDELESAACSAGAGARSVPVHLEIDTGMSRQGVAPDGLAGMLARLGPTSPLRLSGVMTHLYAADEADGRATTGQLERLEAALREVVHSSPGVEWLGVGNSAALVGERSQAIAAMAERYRMRALMRPGLAFYGLVPRFSPGLDPADPSCPPSLAAAERHLRPALSWKARIASLRSVPAGAVVGYNGTHLAKTPARLALIPAGYADGLDRRLGNRFSLLVGGRRAPLVGRISMDLAVLDVTDIPGVAAGDEVVLIGTQGGETITALDHAEAAGTIPWEILTGIGPRVARLEVQEAER